MLTLRHRNQTGLGFLLGHRMDVASVHCDETHDGPTSGEGVRPHGFRNEQPGRKSDETAQESTARNVHGSQKSGTQRAEIANEF